MRGLSTRASLPLQRGPLLLLLSLSFNPLLLKTQSLEFGNHCYEVTEGKWQRQGWSDPFPRSQGSPRLQLPLERVIWVKWIRTALQVGVELLPE